MNDILYMSADYEAQKLSNVSSKQMQKIINKHFVYSILIGNSVTIPIGCYFESVYIQELVKKYYKLFLPNDNYQPIAGLGLGADRESFNADVKIKSSWFPKDYSVNDADKMYELNKFLKDIPPRIRNCKMRKELTENILHDISSSGKSLINLSAYVGSSKIANIYVEPLKKMAEVQEFALLPTYIQIEIDRHKSQQNKNHIIQKRWLDFILFKNYVVSCENAYRAYCNNPLSLTYDHIFKVLYPYSIDYRDTVLFEHFLDIYPLRYLKDINNFSCDDILNLKKSEVFNEYLMCYKEIINEIKKTMITFDFSSCINNEYKEIKNLINLKEKNERSVFKESIVKNTSEAMILYKSLKNPFLRNKNFHLWLKNQADIQPEVQILAYIEDKSNGLLKEYINELYFAVKPIYNKEISNMKRKSNKFLSVFNTGNISGISQTIGSNNKLEHEVTQLKPIHFKALDQEKYFIFLGLLKAKQDEELETVILEIEKIVNSGLSDNQEEFTLKNNHWNEFKKTLSQNILDTITVLSEVAGIASFVMQLFC